MTTAAQPRTRGAHLLDAALTVVAADGLTGLSMRSVAAAAGTSLAQVQYYFHSKDELIRAAFSYVGDQFLTGLDGLSGDVSFDRLRQAIWLWLPLDRDREKAARVWFAFTAAAATNPELAAESERLDANLRSWLAGELQALQHSGDLIWSGLVSRGQDEAPPGWFPGGACLLGLGDHVGRVRDAGQADIRGLSTAGRCCAAGAVPLV